MTTLRIRTPAALLLCFIVAFASRVGAAPASPTHTYRVGIDRAPGTDSGCDFDLGSVGAPLPGFDLLLSIEVDANQIPAVVTNARLQQCNGSAFSDLMELTGFAIDADTGVAASDSIIGSLPRGLIDGVPALRLAFHAGGAQCGEDALTARGVPKAPDARIIFLTGSPVMAPLLSTLGVLLAVVLLALVGRMQLRNRAWAATSMVLLASVLLVAIASGQFDEPLAVDPQGDGTTVDPNSEIFAAFAMLSDSELVLRIDVKDIAAIQDYCCDEADCGSLGDACNEGVCNEPGGSCSTEPLPDRTAVEQGVSVCLNGAVCTLATCGCGFALDDTCGETIRCCGCDDETGCVSNMDCCSGVCVNGRCQASQGGPGVPCDEPDDCLSDRCINDSCCEPRLACEPDECGQVGDGCDGTLDCPLSCNGTPCTGDTNCLSGSCNQAQCQDPAPPGNTCDSNPDCEDPAVCEGGTCRTPDGNPCGEDASCSSGSCNQGNCQLPVPPGQPCDSAPDCAAPATSCDTTCRAPEGTPCTDNAECVSSVCHEGNCITPAPPGAPCDAQVECESGLCEAGTCRSPTGQPCSTDDQCQELDHCADGICTPDIEIGQTCTRPGVCRSSPPAFCECDVIVGICLGPDCVPPPSVCSSPGVCKSPGLGPCTASEDCAEGLTCDIETPPNGVCRAPLNTLCGTDESCLSGQCGFVFGSGGGPLVKPPPERAECCLTQGEACTDITQCCRRFIGDPAGGLPGPPFPVGCTSAGVCDRLQGAGNACTSDADCIVSLTCFEGTCTAPSDLPTMLDAGGECDPQGVTSRCNAGLTCINCDTEGRGWRCVDEDEPCCRSEDPNGDRFWCGDRAPTTVDEGVVSNLCCNYKCEPVDSDTNCGACDNDCTAVSGSDLRSCFQTGPGQCEFNLGEADYACYHPSTCTGGDACIVVNLFEFAQCAGSFDDITVPVNCDSGTQCTSDADCPLENSVCSLGCNGFFTLTCIEASLCECSVP